MSHLFQVAGAGLIVTLIGTIWLAVSGSKKISPKQDEDNGKVVKIYPHSDDPEYSQNEDNYPSWKEAQRN